jgi:hypothetical protein
MGTPEGTNPQFRGTYSYTIGGQAMVLDSRPSPRMFTPSQGGRIDISDPYTPTHGPPPTYGQDHTYDLDNLAYGDGGRGREFPGVVGRQDKFLSPQQLQDQHRELSGQFQSLALAYQSQAAEIEVGRRWRLEREEAVLSSQQQSVVMEQCDQSRMNLRWQTKELLLGKMKSFSNKRLLKTVLEDLKMLEDLSMVWRSLSFSGDKVSITAVNCDEANRCFL